MTKSYKAETGVKLRGADKVARIPVKVIPTETMPRKPEWLRIKVPSSPEISRIKNKLREHKLASVCE
ncbi:MAG: lipoyl synthase, partial [Gammaproteobacteria bacterium]|nr:lipoyl synthase [Gammaproteobacteria bacterium]